MMPELGKYAFAVLSSYGASIGLLCAIIAISLWQGRRIKRQLAVVEARQKEGRRD